MMRKVMLTLALMGLLAVPVIAQFPGMGMMGGGAMNAAALIGQKSVQEELKLTDDQKKAITEANTTMQKAMQSAFQDKDFSGIPKIMEERNAALNKIIEKLDAKQTKRLMQIEVQVAVKGSSPTIFTSTEVQKALKLTDKQKETVKETLGEVEKDVKELLSDAQGDFQKLRGLRDKMTELNKEAYTKITKALTEDQKKTWDTLGGEKFDGKFDTPGFGKGKDKGKKKKDDF